MSGAINFPMTDVYGGYAGTTEKTVPEADDQQALVDDQKAGENVSKTGVKKKPIYIAIALIAILVILGGVVR